MERVVFSIDKSGDLHAVAKFTRYLDTLRAMQRLKGTVHLGCGSWENEYEMIFNMWAIDFEEHVKNSEYVERQRCFLYVSSDWRQPLVLRYRDGSHKVVDDNGTQWYFKKG